MLAYDQESAQICCNEPLLVQLPGTLPFGGVKPHTATALDEIIEQMAEK